MTRLLLTVVISLAPAFAQVVVSARAGLVYTVQGTVTINGQLVHIAPDVPLPQLQPGQVLASTRGHAEVLLGQDAVLWTGNDTQVRLDSDNVDGPRLSLLNGAAILELKHSRTCRHIFIDIGSQTPEISAAGVYRFDRNPDRIRVWSGALASKQPFDKRNKDDLHYFAAYRSLALEEESGHFEHWKFVDNGVYTWQQLKVPRVRNTISTKTIVGGDFKHAGFDLLMSLPIPVARAKYLVASEASIVNDAVGLYRLGVNSIASNDERVELFLGLGITARLNHHSSLDILDTSATAPVVALETGEVMIEVAQSGVNTRLRLRLGDSVVEIHKPGLYRFDMSSSAASHAVRLPRPDHADEFFAWNRSRSLDLWLSDASFMSDWQPLVAKDKVRHKQYGDAQATRTVPVKLPAQLPSTVRKPSDPKPSILDQPIDKSPGER